MDERYMTVEQAAERLQVHVETVRRMLRTGRLEGARIGGRKLGWRVAESEVTRLLRTGERAAWSSQRRAPAPWVGRPGTW